MEWVINFFAHACKILAITDENALKPMSWFHFNLLWSIIQSGQSLLVTLPLMESSAISITYTGMTTLYMPTIMPKINLVKCKMKTCSANVVTIHAAVQIPVEIRRINFRPIKSANKPANNAPTAAPIGTNKKTHLICSSLIIKSGGW